MIDVATLRQDFPILSTQDARGQPLVYLDNAATTQKPRCVVEAMAHYTFHDNANVHRSAYPLGETSTQCFEQARCTVARFMGAPRPQDVVWVKGTTEGINLIASGLKKQLKEGDQIILSILEHHSNIVPWQVLASQTGAVIRVVPLLPDGSLNQEAYLKLLNPKTRIVSLSHASNVLGFQAPIAQMAQQAKQHGAWVIVDGAQAAPHIPIDVQALGCHAYVFSGHKTFGPTGIGALYLHPELSARLEPYQTGGGMIEHVCLTQGAKYKGMPDRFEAGTPNVAGCIGLAAALTYLEGLGWQHLERYEQQLLAYAHERLLEVPGLKLIGTATPKVPVAAFQLGYIHPHDVAGILGASNIAIRAGYHCAQPLIEHLAVPALSRISLAFYNTTQEIDAACEALCKVAKLLG